jgi:site-specific recombinase XerD
MCQGTRGGDRLFLGRSGGPLVPGVVGKLLTRLKVRTGLDSRVTPHTIRHTWARERALAGTDTLIISRLMGHTSLQTTSLYLGQPVPASACCHCTKRRQWGVDSVKPNW